MEQGLSAEQAGDLGEIRVELHYKQVLFQLENPSFHVDMHHIGKISEKALKGKAISHAARYVIYHSVRIVSFLTDIQTRRRRSCSATKGVSYNLRLRPEQSVCYLQIQISFLRYVEYTLGQCICSLTDHIRSSQSVLRNTPFADPRVFG